MSKHITGPWKWDGNVCNYDSESEAPWLVDEKDSFPPILGGQITCANQANARLIAAAPELLEALQELVKWLEIGDYECEMHTKACAAIAKATGEA